MLVLRLHFSNLFLLITEIEELRKSIAAQKSDVVPKINKLGDLLQNDGKGKKHYLYSKFFNSENIPECPTNVYSKLSYDTKLLAESKEFLISTKYNGLDIIVDGIRLES